MEPIRTKEFKSNEKKTKINIKAKFSSFLKSKVDNNNDYFENIES